MNKPVAVVIPAAGSGERLPGAVPKQWRFLGGLPLIAHAFRFFDRFPGVGQIAVALDPISLSLPERLAFLVSEAGHPVRLVAGGASRQESVWNALQALDPAPEIVLVHDAARPFPPSEAVAACIQEARRCGGAILATPVVETIKRVGPEKTVLETLDRRALWSAQTPQGFRFPAFFEACRAAADRLAAFTDDAAVFEAHGGRVGIVEGTPSNFKITCPDDFSRAERMIAQQEPPA